MQRINENLNTLLLLRAESLEQLSELDENVATRAAEYERIFDHLWEARRNAHRSYIDEVFIMRESMTREEWNMTFGPSYEF
jgi:hypothetical protein